MNKLLHGIAICSVCLLFVGCNTGCKKSERRSLGIGDHAPGFSLHDQGGNLVSLRQQLVDAQYIVLVFYPQDDTPGCTAQLCALRDLKPQLPSGVKIIGISSDDTARHAKFSQKHHLPFSLLSDEGNYVRDAYQAYALGGLHGRVTFIINHQGTIVDSYSGLFTVAEHVARVKKLLLT